MGKHFVKPPIRFRVPITYESIRVQAFRPYQEHKVKLGLVKKLESVIKFAYQAHGVYVKIHLHAISNNSQNLIFKLIPEIGTRKSAIFDRSEDIQATLRIPFFLPFEEGMDIYLAVSGKPIKESRLQTMLNSQAFRNSQDGLPIALGYNQMGSMVFADLEKMPHAMYVGATHSGKSTGLLCLIMSLICKHPVSEVNLIIFDIGANTLNVTASIPHLSCPVVKDRDTGIRVLQSLAEEMERRISLDDAELRDLPAIVCVIDEYISFIDSIDTKPQREKVTGNISNLLRRGRKAKIHMVLATQDPKNKTMRVEIDNITSRMAFKVARFQTSITILNCAGAEKLPGKGAFLYQSEEHPNPIYIQGAYMPTAEVKELVMRINTVAQDSGNKFWIPETAKLEPCTTSNVLLEFVRADSEREKELANIILWTLEQNFISVEKIKHKFSMGNRADNIMDKLCEAGLVSEKSSNQPRQVLPQSVEDTSDTVIEFLAHGGTSIDDVSAAIGRRNHK